MTTNNRNSITSSYKIKKLNRKIGGTRRKRPTRNTVRSKIIAAIPVAELSRTETPEPNDTLFAGLWRCDTTERVDAWQKASFDKFNVKALKALRSRVSVSNRAIITALLSQTGAASIPLLTSEEICRESSKMLLAMLTAMVAADPEMEIAFVTIISGDGGTSHFKTDIELHESLKRVQRTLRAMSPDFFGVTELALFNSQGHPDGGQMLQVHTHSLVVGRGVLTKAQDIAAKHAAHFTPNFSGAPVINVKKVATTEINLARISAYLFKAPYKCMNWNPGKDGKRGHMNGSEKGDRFVRYLRLAQLRTLLRYEDMCFGGGAGAKIRSDMIKFVRALAAKDSTAGRRVLHPDAIASFWIALAPEIKADRWNLPIIRTRK